MPGMIAPTADNEDRPSALIEGSVQLNLDVEICGREKELSTLLGVLERVSAGADDDGGISGGGLVLIGGQAGIGKSALVSSLREPTVKAYGGCFAIGKFYAEGGSPHAALADAFNNVCDIILRDPERTEEFRAVLTGNQEVAEVLLPIVPKLRDFFDQPSSLHDNDSLSDIHVYHVRTSDQLRYAFSVLIRAISADRLFVLVLEDLQWADDTSLELIANLGSDLSYSSSRFVIVGTYRGGEDERSIRHAGWVKLTEIKQVEHLKLDVLSLGSINCIVYAATDMKSSDQTMCLAQVIHMRTGGVPFYILQFLRKLFEQKLVRYSFQRYCWEWDLSAIETQTKISPNLADIVLSRIETLAPDLQSFLKVASNLGSAFQIEVVGRFLLANKMTPASESERAKSDDADITCLFRKSVEVLVDAGLIERASKCETRYQFTHDRLQESACNVNVGIDEDDYHKSLGRFLLDYGQLRDRCINNESERLFFVAVSQMNLGLKQIIDEHERVKLAHLNLKASKLARRKSAFVLAGDYALKGVECLRNLEAWSDHYDLSLKLHKQAAEMLECSGKDVASREIANEIINKAVTHDDKMPAYFCRVNMAGRNNNLEGATSEGLKVLASLGEHFPSRQASIFNIIREFIITKKAIKGLSDEQLCTFPETKDQRVIFAMGMMSVVSYYASYGSKRIQSYIPMLYLRMLRLTVKHGLSTFSAIGYSGYSMLSSFGGNVEEGYRFGCLAIKLVECKSMRQTMARVNAIHHSFLSFRKEPLQDGLEPILKAYQVGMETGDVLNALGCAGQYGALYFHTGLPLGPCCADLKEYLRLMETYDQRMLRMIYGIPTQMIMNLMGQSEDPLVLNGQALDKRSFLDDYDKFPNNDVSMWVFLHSTATVAFIFGDNEKVWALHLEANKFRQNIAIASVFGNFFSYYMLGSSGLALWRQNKKRKYKKAARSGLKRLERLVRSGCVSCYPILVLLQSEMLGTTKKATKDEVLVSFDRATSASAKTGALHFRAIALEKAGLYLIDRGEQDSAKSYIFQAMQSYQAWGAAAKVCSLRKNYAFLSTADPQGITSSVSLRGRKRFDASATLRHHRLSE